MPFTTTKPRHAGATTSRRTRIEFLERRDLLKISFVYDYSLDDNGFFNDPERRELLEYAGEMLSEQFSDTLDAIQPSGANVWRAIFDDPATGDTIELDNLNIAENEILIFPGGYNLTGNTLAFAFWGGYAWFGSTGWGNTVAERGEDGAGDPVATDFGPWGGSVAFDTVGTNWHFGRTTEGLSAGEYDFVSVAMHELGHILGIVGGNPSWDQQLVGDRFIGPKATEANGGVGPEAHEGHFEEGVMSDQIEVMMDPTIQSGTRRFLSRLDTAVYDDIGWTVKGSDDSIYRAKHVLTHLSGDPDESFKEKTDIKKSTDVDIHRVYAEAGTEISVKISKNKSIDTYARLFDAAGDELASANKKGEGGKDKLSFTVDRDDYYYVGVSSAGNRSYDPEAPKSGPGGPKGGYKLRIKLVNDTGGGSGSGSGSGAAATGEAEPASFLALPAFDSEDAAPLVLDTGTLPAPALLENRLLLTDDAFATLEEDTAPVDEEILIDFDAADGSRADARQVAYSQVAADIGETRR